jgi:hypothetical protein
MVLPVTVLTKGTFPPIASPADTVGDDCAGNQIGVHVQIGEIRSRLSGNIGVFQFGESPDFSRGLAPMDQVGAPVQRLFAENTFQQIGKGLLPLSAHSGIGAGKELHELNLAHEHEPLGKVGTTNGDMYFGKSLFQKVSQNQRLCGLGGKHHGYPDYRGCFFSHVGKEHFFVIVNKWIEPSITVGKDVLHGAKCLGRRIFRCVQDRRKMNGTQHPIESLQKTTGFLVTTIVVKPVGVPENLECLFHEVRFQAKPHRWEEQPVMELLFRSQESFPLQTGSDVISSLQETPEFVLLT